MSGPASQTTLVGGSLNAAQSPIDILADECFDKLNAMGLQEPPQRVQHDLIHAAVPAGVNQILRLGEEAGRHRCLNWNGRCVGHVISSTISTIMTQRRERTAGR